MKKLLLAFLFLPVMAATAQAQTVPRVTGTFKTPGNQTPSAAGLAAVGTINGISVYGSVDFQPYDSAGKHPTRILCGGVTYIPQPVRAWIKGDGTLVDNLTAAAGVDLVPTIGCTPSGLVMRATIALNGAADANIPGVTWIEDKQIPQQASVDWGTLAAAGIQAITYTGYSTIQDEATSLAARNTVNLTGAGVSCVDNTGSTRTDCTISGTAGPAYATIQDEAVSLTQRGTVNFTGTGMNCVDNAGSARTDCTISSGGSSAWSALTASLNTNAGTFSASGNSWDFTAATLFKLRAGAGLTSSANGDIGQNTTDGRWHFWFNGADRLVPAATNTGVSGQVPISNGDGTYTNADPLITYNQALLLNGVAATATQTSAATTLSTRMTAGSLNVVGAGITGAPAGCTIAYRLSLAGVNTADIQSFAFTPGNNYQNFATTPGTANSSADSMVGVYNCTTFPTGGTITVSFSSVRGVVVRDALPAGANNIGAVNLAQYTPVAGRLPVDGSGVTQPVSAASLPLPSGAAQEHATAASPHATRLTDGTAFYKATTPADTQPVSGTVTGNQGTAAAGSGAWPVTITDTANTVVKPGDAANNAVRVNIIAGAGSGGTAAADNSVFTGGTTNVTPMGALFDATPPAITDGNVGAPRMNSSRQLMVDCVAGCTAGGSFTDSSAFTFGTTAIGNMGAVVDDTATNTVAENSAGAPRMNANRILYFNPRNNAGTEIATASNPYRVDPTGTTTQPVSITAGNFPDNEPFNLSQVGGAAVSLGQKTSANSIPVVPPSDFVFDTVGTLAALNALNTTANVSLNGQQSAGVLIAAGTLTATVVPEVSMDGGTTWTASFFRDPATGALSTSQVFTNPNAATQFSILSPGGSSHARVRVSAFTSGTANATARSTLAQSERLATQPVSISGANFPDNEPFNVAQWNGVALGSPSAYGTSPGAVNVPGVNAFITNTPAVTLASTTITGTVDVGDRAARLVGQVEGRAASGAAKAGNPNQIGGVFNTTQPTVTTGQAVEAQFSSRGELFIAKGVSGFSVDNTGFNVTGSLPAGTNNIGDVDVLTLPPLPAGTNNIGDVDVLTLPANASVNMAQVAGTATSVNGGNIDAGTLRVAPARNADVCNPIDAQQVAVSVAASGSTELVALTAGQTIYVCDALLFAAGTVNVKLVYGTGAACVTGPVDMTGAMQHIAQTGWSNSPEGRLKTAAANALCINLSAAVNVQGFITYRKAATF